MLSLFKLAFGLPALAIMGSFTHTISFGSVIVGAMVALGTLVTLMFGVKYRVLADQQALTISNLTADRDTWKDRAASKEQQMERLEQTYRETLALVASLKEDKAKLEALPNLSVIIDQMSREARRVEEVGRERTEQIMTGFTEVMTQHETSAANRHRELIAALTGIVLPVAEDSAIHD